jgi:DNA repair protein RadC
MTDSTFPSDEICAAALEHHNDGAAGALLAVFLDERRTVLLTIGFDEGTQHVDELFLRHLVDIVTDIRVAAVAFVVVRANGRPTRVDKRLWHELSARLADTTTRLLDVIVVGETTRWSATQSLTRPTAA